MYVEPAQRYLRNLLPGLYSIFFCYLLLFVVYKVEASSMQQEL